MRLIIVLVTAAMSVTASLAVAGCGSSSSSQGDGKRRVVASFYPLAFAAEEIGGQSAEVVNLTPPGAEPHEFELSARDLERTRSADLVLLLGRGFQPQIEKAAGGGEQVLALLDTPGLRLFDSNDPHIWLDPLRYSLVVERIGEALDGGSRTQRLVARLRALDREFERGLARCERREIVTSHEAFGYLADRYRLDQVGMMGLSPEAEPTPGDLEDVISVVRDTGATTVFFEKLVSPRVAETVARETGAKTAVLDPIEGLTESEKQGGEDYFSIMRANLRVLRAALACR